MKIKSITIENVKSFRDKRNVDFKDSFNILIGPNGGGKSNLLDIITIIIRGYFLKSYYIMNVKTVMEFRHTTIQEAKIEKGHISSLLEKFKGEEDENNYIKITLKITEQDIENINSILDHENDLKKELKKYKINFSNANEEKIKLTFEKLKEYKDNFQIGTKLTYTIKNYEIEINNKDSRKNLKEAYLYYLNYLELFILLSNLSQSLRISLFPVYLYFSPYRTINYPPISLAQFQERNELYKNYILSNSRSTSSIIDLASLHFAEKKRKLESEGKLKNWDNDIEVKLIREQLRKLGYGWDIIPIDSNQNTYEFVLKNNDREILIHQASSGEKEIFNFLMGIIGFRIKGGLIIIEEPELHLHPRWQLFLISSLKALSKKHKNQFILSTHSPVIINEKTISDIIRVYKDNGTSSIVKLKKKRNEFNKKDIIHTIKSHNNEKLFFADKVVLVEGITDRLILQKLIEYKCKRENCDNQIIEVLEVGGKNNFPKYEKILESIRCKYFIIADLDYVVDLAQDEKNTKLANLFETDYSKIDNKVINAKKSKDAKYLSEKLEEAINNGQITENLINIWNYIKNRHRKLKELSEDKLLKLEEYINKKKKEKVFILFKRDNGKIFGEIEDFLPEEYKGDTEKIIKLVEEENFKKWLKDEGEREKRKVLEDIVNEIIKN